MAVVKHVTMEELEAGLEGKNYLDLCHPIIYQDFFFPISFWFCWIILWPRWQI
jgi:hypothetical protein